MPETTVICEDCGGRGVDPGSLHYPEECPSCCGSGVLVTPEEMERVARKWAGRADRIAPDRQWEYYEERGWKCG